MLLHGTASSRRVWAPLLASLAERNDVLAVDLPGHGDSPATSYTPPEWAGEVAVFLDEQGLEKVAVVGHSSGGWTALELAKLGRAESVLALTPAGLWRKYSPVLTDINLNLNWRLGRLFGPLALRTLASPSLRSLSLRGISARPRDIPAEVAIENARAAMATDSFPRHFSETRRLRFMDGQDIEVPVKVIWGDKDRVALQGKSRNLDQLPPRTEVETWPGCGHMLMWDAPDKLLTSALELTHSDSRPSSRHRC